MLTLPQTTQDNKEIFLLDDNLAVCENGLIFYYDDLGKIYDTKYQCVLPKINANTDPKSIQDSIIDLENILIDFFLINLRERTINNTKFEFVSEKHIAYKNFLIDVESFEVMAKPLEIDEIDELESKAFTLDEETRNTISALISLVYRQNIDNFVEYKKMLEYLEIEFEKI
ncbi:hypothetical protein [Helicobacter equorum]|uniref:Uncharacterized protein n=1 Tax=Helicobacter equorum TaxID=361872 RepID=A0A3D8IMY0_9HELI|nr:hypothetical protein [Helicobacter equorum]RDU66463.1 hypothetical protein CQA54_07115 [Helicobacter equorum]